MCTQFLDGLPPAKSSKALNHDETPGSDLATRQLNLCYGPTAKFQLHLTNVTAARFGALSGTGALTMAVEPKSLHPVEN